MMVKEVPFREWIKEARLRRGWNKSRFAKITGISRNMILRYESGSDQPTLPKLVRILGHLQQPVQLEGFELSAKPTSADVVSEKQYLLEFGQEYSCQLGSSSVKIKPAPEGLLIQAEKKIG
jgi:transcriptional regulator with XRE-family HTH domain